MTIPETTPDDVRVEEGLAAVRSLMMQCLLSTPLREVATECRAILGNGKMLRARLGLRIGPAAGTPQDTIEHAAAAVEMIHAASLLHDDVIDGGTLRRGAPSFWKQRGVSGAILLGDLLLFRAVDIVCRVENSRLAHPLVLFTGDVCQAESEQELIYRGHPAQWSTCVKIARHKTGALFAFAAFSCGGKDLVLSDALKEAGYDVGTAYQLADDILDAMGNPEHSDKTLGTDSARNKNTAVTFLDSNVDPVAFIEDLCRSSRERLSAWPAIQAAWDLYLERDLYPSLKKNIELMVH